MELQYYVRNVYGTPTTYLVDSPAKQHVINLTGRKTLTASDVIALEALGFTFKQVFDPGQ